MSAEKRESIIRNRVIATASLAVVIAGWAFMGYNFITEAIPANFDPSSPKFKSLWPNRTGWEASYAFENCSGVFCEPQDPENTAARFSGIIDTSREPFRCPTLQYTHTDDIGAFLLHSTTWRLKPETCKEL